MSEASFASLSPTLLARKGAAKPAMRPQVQPLNPHELHGQGPTPEPQDDLGWNDMGEEAANDAHDARPKADVIAFEARAPLESRFMTDKADKPAAKKKPRTSAAAKGRRAAFTLRIDPERHLKLRLACTLNNCSAQSLLTDALDTYLAAHGEITELAAQVGDKQRSN